MKKAIFTLLAATMIVGLAFATMAIADTSDDDSPAAADEQVSLGVYACPMGCDDFLTTDPEAECPVCGMNVSEVDELYVCPDHPTEFSIDPDAVCEDTENEYVAVEQLYVCPMHPEQISVDPEGECGECGMDLVAVEAGDDDEDGHGMMGMNHDHSNHSESGGGCSGSCGGHH